MCYLLQTVVGSSAEGIAVIKLTIDILISLHKLFSLMSHVSRQIHAQ